MAIEHYRTSKHYDSPYQGVVDYEFLMWMQAEAEYEQLEQGESPTEEEYEEWNG